jgi:hypothetical protein
MKLLYTLCNIRDRLVYGKPTKEQQSLRDYLESELDSGKWDSRTFWYSTAGFASIHTNTTLYRINSTPRYIEINDDRISWFYGASDILVAAKNASRRQEGLEKNNTTIKQQNILKSWYEDVMRRH